MTETRPHDVAAIKGVLESHNKAWDAGDAAGASAGIRCSKIPRSSRPSVWRPDSTPRDLSTSGVGCGRVGGWSRTWRGGPAGV